MKGDCCPLTDITHTHTRFPPYNRQTTWVCEKAAGTLTVAAHSAVNGRIILELHFSLSNTAKADNKCTISNYLIYIINAFMQVKLKIILKYHNQYFCLLVVHFSSRLSQPISVLPVDLVIFGWSASLHRTAWPRTITNLHYFAIHAAESLSLGTKKWYSLTSIQQVLRDTNKNSLLPKIR